VSDRFQSWDESAQFSNKAAVPRSTLHLVLETHDALALSHAEDLGKLCSADTGPMSYTTRIDMDETALAGGKPSGRMP
jgi:hypothetical protein